MPITLNGVTLADEERQPCEVWSRVMGYYRPVDQWNIGKRSEHAERVYYDPTIIEAAASD